MATLQVRMTPKQIELAAEVIRLGRAELVNQEEERQAAALEARLRYLLARWRSRHPDTPAG